MPITAAHAGRSYPPTPPIEVSAAKIHEFARALGDEVGADVGLHPVAPPTFAALLAGQAWEALFADEELELELRRTIHYDQAFEFERLLRAGEWVTAELQILKVRVRAPRAFVTVQVTIKDADGVVVCTAVSTLIHTTEESK